MQKKLFAGLAAVIFALSMAFSAQAALVEINPVSYLFDKLTDTGDYNYSDWGGVQLTDGQYGTAPWQQNLGNGPAYEWVGWVYDSPVNIDFDFGGVVEINQINIGTVQDNLNNVVLPSVNLYSSSDGANWSFFHDYIVPESNDNNNQYFTYEFSGIAEINQYFRVSLYHSYDGPWTFTDEIDFYQEPVPEPASILLIGVGMACLVGSRIWRENNS